MIDEFAALRTVSVRLLDRLSDEAAASVRGRMHLNLHTSHSEGCQRFLNAMEPHSYVRPHRQLIVPRRKLLVGIRGRFAAVLFDDAGSVDGVVKFGAAATAGNVAVEIPAGRWNTVVSLEPRSVLLEVKSGPFDPNGPQEMAPWAPAVDEAQVAAYLAGLHEIAAKGGASDSSWNS